MKRKTAGKRTHGESHTHLHNVWCGINNRCDPNHKNSERYGNRGITVCNEWVSYESFSKWARENGYKEGLTIERIDVNGNYCPENCTWIPISKQARNRRTTFWVEYMGRKMSLAEACEIAHRSYKNVWQRIKVSGWSFEDAISIPESGEYKKKKYNHNCVVCGKAFLSLSDKSKYCSHECYVVYRLQKRHGDFISR